ncbi:MAG: beta-galactosidase [Bacillota bacterium]
MAKYPPINPKYPHMLHGGDYNPEQWLHMPNILKEDLRLMKLAKCNAMSVGIFAWSALEPKEGLFEFGWLDKIMDDLAAAGIFAVLATPSGARPAWMSQKYPEVLRVAGNRVRNLHGIRHNHCFTSPVYRDKVNIINTKLAERYKDHPALLVWHVSNEYNGECHCDLCQDAFRAWLKTKYRDSLENLNRAWYTAFWSHTFTDWRQVESPAPHGEPLLHGLNLDWKRFVTDQTVDFMMHEIGPLRRLTPNVPVTTNLMGTFPGLNYWKLANVLDVVSWDNYPSWHHGDQAAEEERASYVAFVHNLNRSLKGGRPFMLMESTPSATNWQDYAKLKRPGMHLLSSLQAVAHGSDTVQYFQWRKARGSSEKFHGAVVDHAGHERTRVFKDVAQVGEILSGLDEIVGTTVPAETAVIFDWENRWAMEDAKGPRNDGELKYEHTCHMHYLPFWKAGIPCDIIDMEQDLSGYKLVVAPMTYMIRPGVAERIDAFVRKGGTLVVTYWSGIVDENDLCFLGGFPGPLRRILGIWSEEIDALGPGDSNRITFRYGNKLNMKGSYQAHTFCEVIHTENAEALAVYEGDFYAGRPALTMNSFSLGKAFYIACRTENKFLADFYGALIRMLGIRPSLEAVLPEGVTAHRRSDGKQDFIFVMNFRAESRKINLGKEKFADVITGAEISGVLEVGGYGVKVMKKR